jgi:hypothetical protein
MGIDDGRAHELESPRLEVGADAVRDAVRASMSARERSPLVSGSPPIVRGVRAPGEARIASLTLHELTSAKE